MTPSTPVCCYCDTPLPLSCLRCGREQPDTPSTPAPTAAGALAECLLDPKIVARSDDDLVCIDFNGIINLTLTLGELRKASMQETQGDEPERLVGDDLLSDMIAAFSYKLLEKLRAAQAKGRHGWDRDDWKSDCQRGLNNHLAKGDPLDVAAYCAFLWYHGWPTVGPLTPEDVKRANALAASQQSPRLEREKIKDAIRTFCKSMGAGAVAISSDGVERIYYSGISLDALSVAVAMALRNSAPQETRGDEPVAWLEQVRTGLRSIVDLKNPLPRSAVREAVAELLASLPAPQQSPRLEREVLIEECAKIARAMAVKMLNELATPSNIRGLGPDDTHLKYGHRIADRIEADIKALTVVPSTSRGQLHDWKQDQAETSTLPRLPPAVSRCPIDGKECDCVRACIVSSNHPREVGK